MCPAVHVSVSLSLSHTHSLLEHLRITKSKIQPLTFPPQPTPSTQVLHLHASRCSTTTKKKKKDKENRKKKLRMVLHSLLSFASSDAAGNPEGSMLRIYLESDDFGLLHCHHSGLDPITTVLDPTAAASLVSLPPPSSGSLQPPISPDQPLGNLKNLNADCVPLLFTMPLAWCALGMKAQQFRLPFQV